MLHLLAARDIRPAIALYAKAGLHREAAALATARLLPGDPDAVSVQRAYGSVLCEAGNYEAAAAQYLAGRCLAEARKLVCTTVLPRAVQLGQKKQQAE